MENAFKRYTENSWSGKKLLESHSLDEEGTWRIYGEDPNCDFVGHHYEPELGLVEGKLRDVIEYAVNLNGFWQWGGGGRIVKQDKPKKISPDANRERKKIETRILALENELEAYRAKLKEM
ncbi:hypothetical protein [Ralstonia phage RSP15]|uniref:hypothetical protein n=1 Tax=Ralstonia phage RSP15 TaxID=1785960 RepID=UPI00074D4CF3|nr:hypothetical protein BH754_gp019 [Ralstonia phage RSP15]BAU39977.1 hypothetical protein [Ralstonia phage RSP15]